MRNAILISAATALVLGAAGFLVVHKMTPRLAGPIAQLPITIEAKDEDALVGALRDYARSQGMAFKAVRQPAEPPSDGKLRSSRLFFVDLSWDELRGTTPIVYVSSACRPSDAPYCARLYSDLRDTRHLSAAAKGVIDQLQARFGDAIGAPESLAE